MRRPFRRWYLGAGLAAVAGFAAAQRAMTPQYPDVALHAGLELVSVPRRVLALSPHPMDLEWFCGGTCYLLKRAGGCVTVGLMTAGERGGNRANMAEIRERERAQSGAILGYQRAVQLSLPDGGLATGDLVPKLEALWQEVNPEVVFAFDPSGALPWRPHPDHVAAGAAVLELVRARMDGKVRVYLYGGRQPNVTVDITEVLQEKEAAVRAHRSQLLGPDKLTRQAIRGFARLGRGRTPSFYAETFYRLV